MRGHLNWLNEQVMPLFQVPAQVILSDARPIKNVIQKSFHYNTKIEINMYIHMFKIRILQRFNQDIKSPQFSYQMNTLNSLLFVCDELPMSNSHVGLEVYFLLGLVRTNSTEELWFRSQTLVALVSCQVVSTLVGTSTQKTSERQTTTCH